MLYVCRLDIALYSCVTENIATDEVVITEKQIQHIIERHPGDYEKCSVFLPSIIKKPDFILEANKPNTAVVLKEILYNESVVKTILRLATSADNANYKNSIITFMKIDKQDWNRLLRNKIVLYKRE